MIRSRTTADEFTLDPQVAAELADLDAALRGDAVDDEQLVALVRDVRAQAPEMPSDLRKRLRHEVSEGFPRARRGARTAAPARASSHRPTARRRALLTGSGVLVAGFVAVLVVIATTGGTGNQTMSASSSETAASSPVQIDQMDNTFDRTPRGAVTLQGSTASSASSAHSTEQGNAYLRGKPTLTPFARSTASPPVSKLKPAVADLAASSGLVERSVQMVVRVKSGKLDDATASVGQIARAAGGYVDQSQVSLRDRGSGVATFTLRVASSKLDSAVGQLAALGTVTQQDQQSDDITSSFDSVQSRLSDATKVRAALLRALGKATTATQISSLKTRIADNRKLRASLDRQLGSIKRRADLTTISLTMNAPTAGAAAATDEDGHWSLGDALHDTGRILGTVTGGLLVAAGALLPFAILALLGWPIYRARRKRLREATLS